ncbi:hypothetical protein D3C75_1356930 [compost metagenome]
MCCVVVVLALYAWANESATQQGELCDAAQSYWEELESGAEAKRLEEVLWDSCWREPNYVE